jgi:SAM-dependent methyltransferase
MSNDWSAGYMADVGYTYGYYGELNPLRAQLAFLNAGLLPPQIATACELGFGQGMSINTHASASTADWYGTDFNPAQAGFAQSLAQAADNGAQLFDESFAEFAERDLPQFDYIGLHGIWSWVSDENRAILLDFIRRKLKVGGVLYISYNALPGWAKFAPIRQLMAQHAHIMGAEGNGAYRRSQDAIAFVEGLLAVDPIFARVNPGVPEKLGAIKAADPNYVAHEYFNRHWVPMYFSEVAEVLSGVKLNYACSAHFLDHVDTLNLSEAQQQYLRTISDPVLQQTARDFLLNTQFRRDFWVKGARKLGVSEQLAQLRKLRVVLTRRVPEVQLKVKVTLGEATLAAATYSPVLAVLADLEPKTLAEIELAVAGQGVSFANIMQTVIVLCGSDQMALAQDVACIAQAQPQCDALNSTVLARALFSSDIHTLASPVTGGGLNVNWFEQLFLLARQAGVATPGEWADYAWKIMESRKQKLKRDGRTLESAEETKAELLRLAIELAEQRLPVLEALKVVPKQNIM